MIRVVIVAMPILAGAAAALLVANLVPRPNGAFLIACWWAGSFAVSTVVMIAVASQARRLLPLAMLLKLSMAFPDKTPSRFAIALRAGTIGNLKARLAEIRDQGIESEASAAAETILVLSAAMNAHDKHTRGHAERVRAFTEMVAAEMGLDEGANEKLRWSALLHDVGKVMVSPDLLNKAGPLDDHEWEVIHRHPDDGARIAAPLKNWLGEWSLAIEQHHEKWDGTGYPRQLAGTDISRAARIVAVADAFEVMTAPRPYKAAMSATAARKELADGAGTHFDPAVVRAFLALSIGKLQWMMGPLAWFAQVPFLRTIGSAGSSAASAGGAAAIATGSALGLIPFSPPPAPDTPPAHVAQAPVLAGAPVQVTITPARQRPAEPPTTAARVAAPTPAPAAPTTVPTTRPNRAPVAVDDTASTQSKPSRPVKINLVANDSDADGDPLTVSVLQPPTKGKANASEGSVNYIPDTDATGPDTFVYRVCDSRGACDTGTVTVQF